MKLSITGLFTLVIVTMSWPVLAENVTKGAKSYKIGLNTGLYNYGSIDELYSFALYSGKGINYGLKFWNGTNKRNHLLALRLTNIDRQPHGLEVDPNYFDATDPILIKNSFLFEAVDHYRYLIKKLNNKHIKLYGQAVWLTSVNITSNAYSLPELIQSGLGTGLYSTAALKKHQFSVEVHVPVITLTVRNNYSMSMTQNFERLSKLTFIKQNIQLQFPNSIMAIYSAFQYEYAISKHFSVEGEYHFRYMLNTSPQPLRAATGIYSINLYFNF